MKVILLERIEKLGTIGATVDVKSGYARNYLLPMKKAIRYTDANVRIFEERRMMIEKENHAMKAEADVLSDKVSGCSVNIITQCSDDGRLYGSISRKDIIEVVNSSCGVDIDPKCVTMDSKIKNIGKYSVMLRLHSEVFSPITLIIARSEDEAAFIKSGKLDLSSDSVSSQDGAESAEEEEELPPPPPASASSDEASEEVV